MGLDAAFVSQSVPAVMVGGQYHPVRIRMRNSGTETWDLREPYRLGTESPRDNLAWGSNRAVPQTVTPVPPGAELEIEFMVCAPCSVGDHVFQWRMVQENLGWFGETTPVVKVRVDRVVARDAVFVSQNVPLFMSVGKTYGIWVRMKNCGQVPWSASERFALGSQNPQDNLHWGANRILLAPGEVVPPGAEKDFRLQISPPRAGSFRFQWRMVQDGVCWFGGASETLEVSVS